MARLDAYFLLPKLATRMLFYLVSSLRGRPYDLCLHGMNDLSETNILGALFGKTQEQNKYCSHLALRQNEFSTFRYIRIIICTLETVISVLYRFDDVTIMMLADSYKS